mmetsp:Transcript_32414/g.94914  ORF Transcript_32414/g.94914 Transcript_32414/m.94914 type:complete len:212 (+) Transcript_32414:313-948(+)
MSAMTPPAVESTTAICAGSSEASSRKPATTQMAARIEPNNEQRASLYNTWLLSDRAKRNFAQANPQKRAAHGKDKATVMFAPTTACSAWLMSLLHVATFTMAKNNSAAELAAKVAPMPMALFRSRSASRAARKRLAVALSPWRLAFGRLKRHKTNAEENASNADSTPKPTKASSSSRSPKPMPNAAAMHEMIKDNTEISRAANNMSSSFWL